MRNLLSLRYDISFLVQEHQQLRLFYFNLASYNVRFQLKSEYKKKLLRSQLSFNYDL